MANPDFKNLLLLARRDQKAMLVLAKSDDPELVFNIGFLAQQAIEKALKAAVNLNKLEYPHTHKLNVLHGLLIEKYPAIPVTLDELNRLTPYAVESRYDLLSLFEPFFFK
jgi:HEPN domain-containing protein